MTPFLEDMATAIADGLSFDIVITSAKRSARAQAIAMKNKIARGENLRTIYADDQYADDVTEAYPDLNAMTVVTQRYADAGGGSKHTSGQGLDLRTWDPAHVEPMIARAESLGYKAVLESDHLHIGVGTSGDSGDAKKSYMMIGLLLVGGLWMLKK